MHENETANFKIADLSEEALNHIKQAEQQLSDKVGKDVVLVAYESDRDGRGETK